MKTYSLLSLAAVLFALANAAHAQSDDSSVRTRFGLVAAVSDPGQSKVTLNGKPIAYPNSPDFAVVGDASSLSLAKQFSIGDSDIVLVIENSGGTACPMTYSFVTVNSKGATITKPVADDHCSDIYKVSQSGNKIVLKVGKKVFNYSNGNVR